MEIDLHREPDGFDISTPHTVTTSESATVGTGCFSLSKVITLSENKETETGEGPFGTTVVLLASVVSCAPLGTVVPVRALSWVNVATPPGPSSVSRRLSREFRLG